MKRALGLLVCGAAMAAFYGLDSHPLCAVDAAGGGKGTVVKLGALSATTPASWKEEKPTSQMRTNQFKLPRAAGDKEDAELIVFFFADGGGTVADNIKRWQGMFVPPAGKTIDDVSKIEKFKAGGVNVTYLDVSGTYLSKNPPFDPNAKTTKKPDFRRFGVLFETPGGLHVITVTGPAPTMQQNK